MATSTVFQLQPPAIVEDVMEMSSPARGAQDDDIEIDFYDHLDTNIDDQMQDDVKSLQFYDDEMQDEDHNPAVQFSTTTTSLGHVDDDLIDYSDEEDLEPTKAPDRLEVVQGDAAPSETVLDDTWPAKHENDTLDDSAPVLVFEEHDELTGEVEDEDEHKGSALEVQPEGPRTLEHEAETVPAADAITETTKEEHDSEPQSQLDTTVQAAVTEVSTPTDTGLHPMIFYYDDAAFPMFRSKSSPDGLLKDDNLVSVSLADLMKSCRQRLTLKTQNDIDENYEMLFFFNSLQLSVSEDSPASFQTCLKDVLDVYVQLHENEGYAPDDIPIFEITCSLQMKFHSSIKALQQAAAGGEGISKFTQYETADDIQHDDHHDEDTYAAEEEEGGVEVPEGSELHDGREEPEHQQHDDITDDAPEANHVLDQNDEDQTAIEVPDEDFGEDDNDAANEADLTELQNELFETVHEMPHDETEEGQFTEDDAAAVAEPNLEDVENDFKHAAGTDTTNEPHEDALDKPLETNKTQTEQTSDATETHTTEVTSVAAAQPGNDAGITNGNDADDLEDDFDFVVDDDDHVDGADHKASMTTPSKRVREADEDDVTTSTANKKARPS